MLYLVPVPFIVIAVIVKVVADTYKLKTLAKISRIAIFIGMVIFIYFYAKSLGFDAIDFVYKFFKL